MKEKELKVEDITDDELVDEYIKMLESYKNSLMVVEEIIKVMSEKERILFLTEKELKKRNINIEEQ